MIRVATHSGNLIIFVFDNNAAAGAAITASRSRFFHGEFDSVAAEPPTWRVNERGLQSWAIGMRCKRVRVPQ